MLAKLDIFNDWQDRLRWLPRPGNDQICTFGGRGSSGGARVTLTTSSCSRPRPTGVGHREQ